MNEASWRRLLSQIRDGLVVPVVGEQLLVAGADGEKSLQALVAERVLALYGQPMPAQGLQPFHEVNEVVSMLRELEVDKQPLVRNPQDLYGDVYHAMRELAKSGVVPEPAPIARLARIDDFRLFVTLTPDDLLARSLRKRRTVNEIVHSPDLATSAGRDLPPDWRERSGEAQLLYLFGKACPAPLFAINDEDVLEYAHSMFARHGQVPARFLEELQQHNLLMIGCNFPDWLSRLFLRLTNKSRLSAHKTKREWLVEPVDAGAPLVRFLKSYSRDTEILSDIGPLDFVAELHRRWLAEEEPDRSPPAPAETPPAGALFFVSYSRKTDLPRAESVVRQLLDLGLGEREIWFDRQAIEPGENFRHRILDGIGDCRYFLPLVSDGVDEREEGFVFREWRAANERRKGMNREFVYPLIVDPGYAPERYTAEPVREWRDLDFGHAPDGVPDARTRAKLTALLRDARRLET